MDLFFTINRDIRRSILLSWESRFVFFATYNLLEYKSNNVSIPKKLLLLHHFEYWGYYKLLEWMFANYVDDLTLLKRKFVPGGKYWQWIVNQYKNINHDPSIINFGFGIDNKLVHYFITQRTKIPSHNEITEYYKTPNYDDSKIEISTLSLILDYMNISADKLEDLKHNIVIFALSLENIEQVSGTNYLDFVHQLVDLIKQPEKFYISFLEKNTVYSTFYELFLNKHYKCLMNIIHENFNQIYLNAYISKFYSVINILNKNCIPQEPLNDSMIKQIRNINTVFVKNGDLITLKLFPKYYSDDINLQYIDNFEIFKFLVDNGVKCTQLMFESLLRSDWNFVFYVLKTDNFTINRNNENDVITIWKFAAQYGSTEFLDWLRENNISLPTETLEIEVVKIICENNPKTICWLKDYLPHLKEIYTSYIDKIDDPNQLLTIVAGEYKYNFNKNYSYYYSNHNSGMDMRHYCMLPQILATINIKYECDKPIRLKKVICNDCAYFLRRFRK